MSRARALFAFISGAAVVASCLCAPQALAQQVKIPPPASAARTEILDAIRPDPHSKIRFVVHSLRVITGKTASFAYASVEPSKQEYDGGEYVLQRDGGTAGHKWRVIWAIAGGGTNSCADIADYFQALTQHLKRHAIPADALRPGHGKEARHHAAAAAADRDCAAIGDLGPDLPAAGAR
jgi:hypothetical protein